MFFTDLLPTIRIVAGAVSAATALFMVITGVILCCCRYGKYQPWDQAPFLARYACTGLILVHVQVPSLALTQFPQGLPISFPLLPGHGSPWFPAFLAHFAQSVLFPSLRHHKI